MLHSLRSMLAKMAGKRESELVADVLVEWHLRHVRGGASSASAGIHLGVRQGNDGWIGQGA
jgi:hypothetical protein